MKVAAGRPGLLQQTCVVEVHAVSAAHVPERTDFPSHDERVFPTESTSIQDAEAQTVDNIEEAL